MSKVLEVHVKMYQNLTKCAKIGIMLINSERILPILAKSKDQKVQEIHKWFSQAISDFWEWVAVKNTNVKEFYEKYLSSKVVNYLGYIDDDKHPKSDAAFNACLNTLFYIVEIMYNFSSPKLHLEFPIPSEIADTDDLITFQCLEWAVKASDDEQTELAWQEKVINQLLKDHYTEEFDALGELIGREYFEPFL